MAIKLPRIELTNNLKVIREKDLKTIVKPGDLGATFELIVSDTITGKVTEHRPPELSKSYVRGFLELLWILALPVQEPPTYAITDTAGLAHEMAAGLVTMSAGAPINIDTWGIQTGIGVGAVTINDNALGTKITHGVGAGQLQYGAVTFGAPSSDATTSQFTVTRNFANGSGGGVTPTEIGLVVKGYRYDTSYFVLAIRDVIGGGILIPNGQTLTVNYRPTAVI